MSTTASDLICATPDLGRVDSWLRNALFARLEQIDCGRLTIREGSQRHCFGEPSADPELDATIEVRDAAFHAAVVLGGSIGAAESYVRGEWNTDDLTRVVRLLVRNLHVLDGMESGLARLGAPLRKALHWLNRNTRSGSRRNIEAHYDLGNEFFAQFLDETLMYSSAVFEFPQQSLQEAQLAKLDRICRKLALTPDDHVLEIGSGWGSFAIHAARHYGCKVTTTTISPAQFALARQRIDAAGLSDRIELLQRDYRDLTGRYDKIVSIEMIEAVGHQFYETFFRRVSELLVPQGMLLLQAITIADHRYERARRSVDFIQRYIFPGSTIPAVAALCNAAMHGSDLRLFHLEDIGPHYATTLRHWRTRFNANLESIRALGYSEAFCRLWEFYFCYCEGGFAERALGDVQMLMVKPGNRREPVIVPIDNL